MSPPLDPGKRWRSRRDRKASRYRWPPRRGLKRVPVVRVTTTTWPVLSPALEDLEAVHPAPDVQEDQVRPLLRSSIASSAAFHIRRDRHPGSVEHHHQLRRARRSSPPPPSRAASGPPGQLDILQPTGLRFGRRAARVPVQLLQPVTVFRSPMPPKLPAQSGPIVGDPGLPICHLAGAHSPGPEGARDPGRMAFPSGARRRAGTGTERRLRHADRDRQPVRDRMRSMSGSARALQLLAQPTPAGRQRPGSAGSSPMRASMRRRVDVAIHQCRDRVQGVGRESAVRVAPQRGQLPQAALQLCGPQLALATCRSSRPRTCPRCDVQEKSSELWMNQSALPQRLGARPGVAGPPIRSSRDDAWAAMS